ncbi:MAG: type VII secretion integral membrane protein EccD [Mycobacterium sp.]|nr:type VII secretion integral membrane protein EccD [Mycobacterium sp.]
MTAIADRVRVSIRTADRDVDLAVAAHLPLRDLLPAVLDAVTTETGSDVTGRAVCLSHPLAGPLDAAKSLTQSGVHDGEILVLTDVRSPRVRPESDPCEVVAAAVRSAQHSTGHSTPTVAAALIGWSTVMAASLLGWPALAPNAPRHVIPTAGAGLTVLLAAWLFQRRDADARIMIGLAFGACGFAALAGWLAVPGGPAPANAALALSACAVVALAASRVCGVAATTLRSACVVSASTAIPTLGAVLQWWPAAAIGPVLVNGWLALLSAAPRLVARGAGLSASDAVDEALAARTLSAHRRLTVVVVTATGGTALGCLVTAVAAPRSAASIGIVVASAAILLLRMRIHPERRRAAALAIGAALVSTTLFGTVLTGAHGLVPWLCGVPVAGFVVGIRLATQKTRCASPRARRIASAAEFAAAVAIVPLGCWASGLFGAVRGLSLS